MDFRERSRKDILDVSKRHLRILAAQEADIIFKKLIYKSLLPNNHITGITNSSHNKFKYKGIDSDTENTNNNSFVQHEHENNIFAHYEDIQLYCI